MTGCRSFTANVPGVLDLRSDGSTAAPVTTDKLPVGETTRDGFGAFLTGAGTQLTGADVTVEDRHYWLLGLLPLMNTSMQEEMAAGLGKGALKNVHVGEELKFIDIGIEIIAFVPVVVPFVGGLVAGALGLFMPPMTGQFSGTKIATDGMSGEAMPPPTDPAPPAPETAPEAAPAPAPVTGGAP